MIYTGLHQSVWNRYKITSDWKLGYLKSTETLSVFDTHVFPLKSTSGTRRDGNLDSSWTEPFLILTDGIHFAAYGFSGFSLYYIQLKTQINFGGLETSKSHHANRSRALLCVYAYRIAAGGSLLATYRLHIVQSRKNQVLCLFALNSARLHILCKTTYNYLKPSLLLTITITVMTATLKITELHRACKLQHPDVQTSHRKPGSQENTCHVSRLAHRLSDRHFLCSKPLIKHWDCSAVILIFLCLNNLEMYTGHCPIETFARVDE